jgi:hypothetical protein
VIAALLVGLATANADAGPITVMSLTVREQQTPALSPCHFVTSGTYPQVSSRGLDLRAVNATLRDAVIDDERAFVGPPSCRPTHMVKGTYRTLPRRSLMSASTRVVSFLIPLLGLVGGGNEGQRWISVTARVPSGARVSFLDLLGNHDALEPVAAVIRRGTLRDNVCVRNAVALPGGDGRRYADGLAPVAENFKDFGLTPAGLSIGFPNDDVTGAVCGRIEVTVPYQLIEPYLSSLERELVAAVRPPLA